MAEVETSVTLARGPFADFLRSDIAVSGRQVLEADSHQLAEARSALKRMALNIANQALDDDPSVALFVYCSLCDPYFDERAADGALTFMREHTNASEETLRWLYWIRPKPVDGGGTLEERGDLWRGYRLS